MSLRSTPSGLPAAVCLPSVGWGIPTEDTLAEMRKSDPPVQYLVGTPKGRLGKLEAELLALDWQKAREGVELPTQSPPRITSAKTLDPFPA